jgi:5-methylcytosine-specific restriction endonuclease McrA
MWKRCRKAKLMLNPFCEHCEKYGIAKLAQVVDHIVEIEDGGEVYDLNNLQSLCNAHHNTKTGEEKKKRNADSKNYPSLSDF